MRGAAWAAWAAGGFKSGLESAHRSNDKVRAMREERMWQFEERMDLEVAELDSNARRMPELIRTPDGCL